ncbi:NAD-dependent epimerase/dehydratase family protein, partial [bacterium]|nr:NAD-dependent epimerase/dehydratase family protein [bacterium]
MNLDSKIFIAGHRGLVGSAIVRKLKSLGYENAFGVSRSVLDLTDQQQVNYFFEVERPEYVFLAAAKVGGIGYNKSIPADFIRENLQIQTNVVDASYRNGCKKLLFLGTACIYPKLAPVPIKEEYLMTGPLEETNISYALAKIAGH